MLLCNSNNGIQKYYSYFFLYNKWRISKYWKTDFFIWTNQLLRINIKGTIINSTEKGNPIINNL